MAGPITWPSFYDQQLNADSQPSANGGMTQTKPSRVRQRVAGAAFTNPYLPGKLGTFSHADRKRQVSFQIEHTTASLLQSSPRRMLNSEFPQPRIGLDRHWLAERVSLSRTPGALPNSLCHPCQVPACGECPDVHPPRYTRHLGNAILESRFGQQKTCCFAITN